MEIRPARAFYIKLGPSSRWDTECLNKGIIRFGYNQTPLEAASSGQWDLVHKVWLNLRGRQGTATSDVTQIRNFFEAGKDDLWITFSGGFLWWCFAEGPVKKHLDGDGHYRETFNGWNNKDIKGNRLTTDKLSGNLLKVQGFQGTICKVSALEYLSRKLNCELLPDVENASQARALAIEKIIPLMRMLTWQDFELLVDLVFSNSGWRRISQTGGTQKTIDLELLLPSTGQRAFVQIKSSTDNKGLEDYIQRFEQTDAYNLMFFVWHSGIVKDPNQEKIKLLGPQKLAEMIFDAGLMSWLIEKVA